MLRLDGIARHRDTAAVLADDAAYRDARMPAAVGIETIVANFAGYFGNAVLTERLDLIRAPSRVDLKNTSLPMKMTTGEDVSALAFGTN